jgi:PKD repeat protein
MKNYLLLAVAMLFAASTVFAQISTNEQPYSWGDTKTNFLPITAQHLPPIDVDALRAEDEISELNKDVPVRFAFAHEGSVNINSYGTWQTLANGNRLWRMKVKSTGAKSLNFTFNQFYLPAGAKFWAYSEDQSMFRGAFTADNNHETGEFAIGAVSGESVILEYLEPVSVQGLGQINISHVAHDYKDIFSAARDFGSSGSCNINVNCPSGSAWANQSRSVAMITLANGTRWCSGALINNVNEDGTPYFLTANHCLGSGTTTWIFYFNYNSPQCSPNQDGPLNQSIAGCTLLASKAGSDMALLQLNSTPPSNYNVYYSGWDRSGIFPTSQVGIHHPNGDVKKICFDNNAPTQVTYGSASCWRVLNWESGTTEPGSSGSPLFDQNQRIIGQLYGGTASCSSITHDNYGRFDVSWNGTSSSNRLRDWLDPSNTTITLNGFDPNVSQFNYDAGITNITSPSGTACTNVFTPQVQLTNFGTTTLTSVTINYQTDGGAIQTFNWNGTLTQNSNAQVFLPQITVAGNGAHTFTAFTSNPNGQTDQNPGNNSFNSNFNSSETSVDLHLTFLTDNYPAENRWELRNAADELVESGGPYPGQQTTYNATFCVPMGCYTFLVFDTFGDGLQYQGVVGNYTLSVLNGGVLAQMVAGGNFGSLATHSFCLTGGCTDPTAVNYDVEANVNDGSCYYAPPTAQFTGSPLSVTTGQSVSFTNQSTGSINSYSWSFPGGIPATSSQQNPIVVYDSEGTFDVSLIVTGPTGSDSEVKTNYINVVPPTQNCVTSFPYIENFDNLISGTTALNTGWEQLLNDDFNWEVRSGSTPSSNTGPSNDHTIGNSGGKYIYTEATDPNFPSKLATILSPCFDISTISAANPHVRFYYHMLGASMGSLRVDLFANGNWINDFFVLSGNQGNQWIAANLSLAGYSGVVQFRFRGITGTGTQGWQSDMAIDDFMVYSFVATPGCTDPAANNYNPLATENDGSCEYGCLANEDFLSIIIVQDNYPGETTWQLRDQNNTLIQSGTTNSADICVAQNNCHTFTIFDSYGDGICCGYGQGSYTLLLNGQQIASGGQFTFQESVQFNCVPGSNCSNSISVTEGFHTAPNADSWYTYTPALNGQYRISTCSLGNTCDTKIFLYDYCLGLVWDDTNAGTIAYNDDLCGNQSEITPYLQGGVTYYVRIGDDNNDCGNSAIDFEIGYVGGITGCMDVLACNYSPLATASGPCYYNDDPNCEELGPDLDVLADVFYNSMYLTTISATQNNNYTCLIQEGCVGGYGTREIVRFTTHIKNIGNQDYYIGSPNSQAGQFEWDPCHGHWHYEGYAEYVLYDQDGAELPYVGFKNGFCVLDLECSDGGTAKFTCGNMGITAGCGDYYSSSLACQWLDLTDVPAGSYTMVVKVNWQQSPDALGRYELRYDNNWAHVCISFDRNASGQIINFTKSQSNCTILEDCVGQPFGNSQPDCANNCPGFVVTGDINNSGELDVADIQEYLTGILGNDIAVSACTDVNMDGVITVADAAILSDCEIYGDELIEFGGVHNHCIFGPAIINPDHTTTLSIGDVDFDQNYIDIYVQNPNNQIVGYQFKMSGVVITGLQNLASPQQYPVTPQFLFGSNQIIALSLVDSTIKKNINPTPMLRIFYSALTSNEVCISEIVDIINENSESVLTIIGPCFDTNNDEPIADFTYSSSLLCAGESVNFTDLSTNDPTGWLWSFPGGTPSSSTLQNPSVTYNTPGVYTVSLTASNSSGLDVHTVLNAVTVHGNPSLSATTTSVTCNGQNNGAINLTISGGQSPFTYDWSNGFMGEDPSGLIAGMYEVTVTDFNGCEANISVQVTQPSPLTLTELSNSPSSCGVADGMAIVQAGGGASNYTYNWQPGNLSGAAQTALAPNSYTVSVVDGNMCSTNIAVIITSSGILDCNNVCNGSAFTDNCNTCVGGNTGLSACTADCNGDFGGTAFLDNCNTCVGGNTGLSACTADCNGDFGGTAFLDNCNTCVGGNTGLSACTADCNGEFGGTAFLDNCNTCVGGNTGLSACTADCNGDFGGTAFLDNCNTCVGGNTGLSACTADCNGDFGGTAFLDNCNTCVGGNTGLSACTTDCNGTFGGTAFLDNCNTCVGGNTGLSACIADCNGDFGGTAFLDNCNTCVGGNTGLSACIADCNGEFGGTAFLDNCNTCVGGNTGLSACTADCNGTFGGTAFLDNCNTCVGGNTGLSACTADCNGDFGGTAFLDNCNTCVGGNTGLSACTADCNGEFGGTAFLDNCNTCVGGNTGLSACIADCNGTFGGTAFLDNCNTCVGGSTGLSACTADCNGDFGGTAFLDNCNTCVGGNTGLSACTADCNGTFGGTAFIDNCNTCVGGNTGLSACTADCNGEFGGTAFLDNCNTCVGGNTGLSACIADCNGDFGGTAFLDNCNTCVGGNTGLSACIADCNGDFGGTAFLDNCNTCVGGNTGLSACTADCNGDFGGTAFLDNCNTCVGGNTGLSPCPEACNLTLTGTTTTATLGFANGSATVVATGGQEPYTYQWSDSFEQTTATATGLFPGTYTCVVTDANDCTESIQLIVSLQTNVPLTQVRAQFCNTSGYALSNVISCDVAAGSSNYRWQFTPQGGSPLPEYTRGSNNYNVRLSWVSGIQLGTTYEVRVKAFVNGQWGEYGPMCTITTSSVVPLTEVHPNFTPNFANTNSAYVLCNIVVANSVAGAEAFGWELTGPNTLFAETPSYNLALSSVTGIQLNTTYQVRVRILMSGVWGAYGPPKPINLGMPPTTVLIPSLCNTTRAINQAVAAVNVCGAVYTFRFQHPTEVERTLVRTVYTCPLWLMNPALTPGETYSVSVNITQNGFSSGYGAACPITIAGPQTQGLADGMMSTKVLETGSMSLFPNPNFGGEVRLQMESIEEGAHMVNITVYDIFGKQISTEAFGYEGTELSHVLRFNNKLAAGIYTVHVVIDGESFAVERMVVN